MATQQELAEHIDLSTRRVRELVKAGIIPGVKNGPGGYDLNICRLVYIRHLRGIASGKVSADCGTDLVAEKQRLEVKKLNLEVEKLEMSTRREDKKWMEIEDHWRLLAGLMVALREQLDFQAQVAAPELCELAGGDAERAGQLVDRLVAMVGAAYNGLCGDEIEHACFGEAEKEKGDE